MSRSRGSYVCKKKIKTTLIVGKLAPVNTWKNSAANYSQSKDGFTRKWMPECSSYNTYVQCQNVYRGMCHYMLFHGSPLYRLSFTCALKLTSYPRNNIVKC